MQPVVERGEQELRAEMHIGPYRLVKHLAAGRCFEGLDVYGQ
jgi:hypothetical protein